MSTSMAQRLRNLERLEYRDDRMFTDDAVTILRRVGIEPQGWQEDVLRSTARRVILNCHRQAGKSSLAAALLMEMALGEPGSLSLVASPGERQSKELFKKCTDLYRNLGKPIPAETENVLELQLENGSRIVALPAKESTIRGYSGVRLLIEDEASRVPDDVFYAVLPMLVVSGGRLMLMSTPFGRRGHFYETWENGGSEWLKVEMTAEDNPRIPRDLLEEQRRTMPPLWFDSEFMCEFVDTEDSVFRTEDIDRAVTSNIAPLFGGVAT